MLRDGAERARAHLVAAVTAEEQLKDLPRALDSYRAALVAEPHNRDAFERMRSILDGLLSEVRYAAMPAEEAARKRSQAARTQRSRGKNTASKSEVLAATV